MQSLSKPELEEVFIDVRKAYRLLYFYQHRIMDTAGFIANLFSHYIHSGYALFGGNAPKDGQNLNIDRWAWDWLNMYSYEFHLGNTIKNGNNYELAIAFQADSGFYDAGAEILQTDVDKFPDVEQSVTKIYLYIGKNVWKPNGFQLPWKKDAEDEYVYTEANQTFVVKRYDLSDFRDEENIRAKTDEFKQFAKINGIAGLW